MSRTSPLSSDDFTIHRTTLLLIVEKAFLATRGQINDGIERFKLDSIRDVINTCEGVDFGCFNLKYGCPVTQAGFRGSNGLWFTIPYDKLMHAHLEVPHQLTSGWAVKVVDDLS